MKGLGIHVGANAAAVETCDIVKKTLIAVMIVIRQTTLTFLDVFLKDSARMMT